MSVFKISPTVQPYSWGKQGSSSKVAQLASASEIPGFVLEEGKAYAELWMGTHPTSPSTLFSASSSAILLSDYLKVNPSLIGPSIPSKFVGAKDGNLPFLFKVLSIQKALSIQTHPDLETAKELHRTLPHIYKDPNHKPELAIALTPFRALCGFLPIPHIQRHLRETPELSALIPEDTLQRFLSLSDSDVKSGLKALFDALMTSEEIVFKEQLDILVRRLSSSSSPPSDLDRLVIELNEQYPGDIGVFCAYVLNYVHLNEGEAIFLGAGEPHAYISGDIVETMANSDNVIRAGLTPKLRDVPNLIAGLTYVPAEGRSHQIEPQKFNASSSTLLYDPPIPEFSVLQVSLAEGREEKHRPIDGPSLSVVTGGRGSLSWGGETLDVKFGDVLFIGATTEVVFSATGGDELVLYRAFVE